MPWGWAAALPQHWDMGSWHCPCLPRWPLIFSHNVFKSSFFLSQRAGPHPFLGIVTPEGTSLWERCFWIPLLILPICYCQSGAEVRRKSCHFPERSIAAWEFFFKNAIMCWNIKLYELLFSCLIVSRNIWFRFELKINQGMQLTLGHCAVRCAECCKYSPAKSSSLCYLIM